MKKHVLAIQCLGFSVLTAACSSTTTGGQGGQQNAGGAGGASVSSSSGSAGMGGMAQGGGGAGGMGGVGGSMGSGGSGGDACPGACVTHADCFMPKPVCSKSGPNQACNACYGACDGSQTCMGANTCVSDADCNASPDARCVCAENGCSICVLGYAGGPAGFPDALGEGVWLIGWAGGLDHFSWVRFAFQTATSGTFTLLDPMGVTLTPFYPCEGSGAFEVNLSLGTVTLELPLGCNMPKSVLDFESFFDPGGFPPHAVKGANIQTMGQFIQGFQHKASFCDMGFTMCPDPFQP